MPAPFPPSADIRLRIQEGRRVADAGDLARAETLFREALAACDRRDPNGRLHALGSLMTVLSREGRVFETLVLARHLADRLRQSGWPEAAAGCLATYCETLAELDCPALLDERLAELQALLASLPADAAVMAREAFHGASFRRALARGALAEAEAHAAAFRRASCPREGRRWCKPMREALVEVELHLARGNPDLAYRAFEGARAAAAPHAEPQAVVLWMTMRCYDALGQPTRAEGAARACLALLERQARRPGTASRRLQNALALARWFEARPGFERAAARTRRIAADATLGRLGELAAAAEELAGLGIDAGAAAPDLAAIRRALAGECASLHPALSERLPDRRALLAALRRGDAELCVDGRTARLELCVACRRLRAGTGAWLPVGHLVPTDGPLPVERVRCEACRAEGRS